MKHQETNKIGGMARWGHGVMPIIGRAALVAAAICTAATFAETPDAFLEYVASTGKQYVDTGIRAKSGIRAEMGMMWNSASGWYFTFLGAKKGNDNFLLCHLDSTYYWTYFYGSASQHLDDISDIPERTLDKYHEIASEYTADGRFSATIDDVTATATPSVNGTPVGALDTGLNLYLFARNLNGDGTANLPSTARCYYLKIWTNDVNGVYVLARDLKPCIKGDVAGLYDKVTGEILYSGTATALEAGPEKDDGPLPPAATPLEYVESAGNHFVDTGVRAKSGISAKMGMMWTGSSGYATFLGARNGNDNLLLCHLHGTYYWAYYYGEAMNYLDYINKSINARSLNQYYEVEAEYTTDGRYTGSIDGVTATATPSVNGTPVGALDTGLNLYLFARNLNGDGTANLPSKARCYYLKIWTGEVDGEYDLVRDYLPCKDPSGTVALYDTVSKGYFYPNTGTLTAGPEIVTGGDVAWTGAAGTFALDNAANWSSGKVPTSADTVTIPVGDGEMVFTASSALAFGDVKLIGAGTATIPANVSMKSLDIAPYATARFTAAPSVTDGGIKGAGALVLDPGVGNTLTMTKNNTGFTGEAVVKSGVVKFGDYQSFGKIGRGGFIRVCSGAALDENGQTYYPDPGVALSKAILEEGAALRSNPGYDQLQYSALTTLKLDGDAAIDTSFGNVTISERWNEDAVAIDLGKHTLTVSGGNTFGVSFATISGTGMIDIQEGTTVSSTHNYYKDSTTTCADGTICIREGGKWSLEDYQKKASNLSTKNLILDGQVVRYAGTCNLTVTGSISGKGTTPVLTLTEGAVFKPTGTGYLTITESLSGKMAIDASGLDLESSYDRVPLFKVGSTEMLQSIVVEFVEGTKPGGWVLVKTDDGLGYDLVRCGFSIIIR